MFNLLEALNDKQKEVVNDLAGDYDETKSHPDMFRQYGAEHTHRIILPFKNDAHIEPDETIRKHLQTHGWFISDYAKGHAVKYYVDQKGNKRKTIKNIGKVLQDTGGDAILHPNRLKRFVKGEDGKPIRGANGRMVSEAYQPTMLQYFNADPKRDANKQDLQIVISRHRDDIGGMTSGRCWEAGSCMRLPHSSLNIGSGEEYDQLKKDFAHHSLVAYLTKKGDDDIESPLARVTIKKFTSDDDSHEVYNIGSRVYGNAPDRFEKVVRNFAMKHYPPKEDTSYALHDNLYGDVADFYNDKFKHGLYRDDGELRHYYENQLHDYIDENGVHQPAVRMKNGYMHYKNGMLHLENGQPAVVDGTEKKYYVNGKLHNPNGAAYQYNSEWYSTRENWIHGLRHSVGNVPSVESVKKYGELKQWHKFGQLHQDLDVPAHIETLDDGSLVHIYYKNGKMSRANDLPAKITTKPNGTVQEEYFNDGVPYTPVNKYVTKTLSNGTTESALYDENGELHSYDDKPSKITTFSNGDRTEEYHEHGKVLSNGSPYEVSYYGNGKIASIKRKSLDKFPSSELYDEDGKLLEREWSKNKDTVSGDVKHESRYNPNNVYRIHFTSPNDKYTGHTSIETHDGTTHHYTNYGVEKIAHPNGDIEYTYANNKVKFNKDGDIELNSNNISDLTTPETHMFSQITRLMSPSEVKAFKNKYVDKN